MKMISLIYDKNEWTTYVSVVIKSEICGIELAVRKVIRNYVGDKSSQSSALPKTVDEQNVKCGVVLTQLSQETWSDIDTEEPLFIINKETVLTWSLYAEVWVLVMLLPI
jgi:hypothetical protein